ncbi:MAG: hypothetical protein ACLQM6_07980 [Acidobacteriaceae bacterium]
MTKKYSFYIIYVLLSSLSFYGVMQAQRTSEATLPDSPDMKSTLVSDTRAIRAADLVGANELAVNQQSDAASQPGDQRAHQTKRILGIIPNFRAVSVNEALPAQSAKEKFITASEDTFDYSSFVLPAALAGYSMAIDNTTEFHQGAVGYGRYYWHSFADQSIENISVEAIVPTLTHEDIRYYTLGKGGFFKRSRYALSRAVITRSDAGTATFNIGEVFGAGAAAGISNLYYPSHERTFSNTATNWGMDIGIDAATFVFKEFWPDINQAIFHMKD